MALFGTVSSDIHFRNRIINGDMRIDQRNNGAAVTPSSSAYTIDRWNIEVDSASLSVQRNAGAVTPPSGFTNYLGITTVSPVSISSGSQFSLRQVIEGFNTADFAWGTANAATVTLTFWVRSSLTGAFGGAFRNADNSRSYPFTYNINAANTWEQKTIVVAGDVSGTWLRDNQRGVQVLFGLGVGSTLSGTAGSWSGSNFASATGATSVVGTNGATFYITGVQLEAGSVATPFERRPYGTELALCQRYFQTSYWNAAVGTAGASGNMFRYLDAGHNYANFPVVLKVPMRAEPSCAIWTPNGVSGKMQADAQQIVCGIGSLGNHSILAGVNNIFVGQSVSFSFHFTASSEL